MKPLFYYIVILFLITACAQNEVPPNTLSQQEKKDGWKLLFDGKTSNGWHGANKEKFPEQGWSTENEMLTVLPQGGGGDIVSDQMYSNFELSFDFKAPMNSNSGLKYFVLEDEYEEGEALGLEYQTHIIKSGQLPDENPHPNTMACLYDLLQATNRTVKPVGEWNNGRVIAKGTHVEHWLNGVKVLEYERGGEAFREAVANSKFRVYPNFGEALKGNFLLQDHGDSTSFRNIKIRELCN